MRELFLAITLIMGVILVVLFVTSKLWHPEHNVDRSQFAHWFKSLMRFYADGARIRIHHRGSPATIEVVHVPIEQGSCHLVVRIPRTSWSQPHASDLEKAVLLHGSASLVEDPGALLCLTILVPDIWSPSPATVATQVVNRILDVLGIGLSERFDLEFSGARSLELTLEARRRQKAGLLREW